VAHGAQDQRAGGERRSAANMIAVLVGRGLDPEYGAQPLGRETLRYLLTRQVLRLVRGTAAA
jgi:hypothetical protein